jgi:hypothetical protein
LLQSVVVARSLMAVMKPIDKIVEITHEFLHRFKKLDNINHMPIFS